MAIVEQVKGAIRQHQPPPGAGFFLHQFPRNGMTTSSHHRKFRTT